MDIEKIIELVIYYSPSLIALITIIMTAVKQGSSFAAQLKDFNILRDEVKKSTDTTEYKDQIRIVVEENAKLAAQVKELVAKIDKVKK